MSPDAVAIRRATPSDATALLGVAERDCQAAPDGDVLLAERGGAVLAWIELANGRAAADPFHPTAELVELLRLRARQLRPSPRTARRWNSAISARSATAMLSSAPCTPSR